jgi:acyl-CoA synthetase (AMP-forming)/AMP-acid ligase II
VETSTRQRTLLELLDHGPAEKTAIVLPERHLQVSYGALREQVRAVAAQLVAAGVGRGDRVGIAQPNGLPMLVSFLAASVAGTAAPLNPAYKEEEFRFYLEDTAARVLILPPEGAEEARRAAADRVAIFTAGTGEQGAVTLVGADPRVGPGRTQRSAPTSEDVGWSAPVSDDVALVLHTSGSTGRPKRVPLTHANLTVSAANIAECYALGPDDVSMCVMPLFHVHGLMASTLSTLATGGTVILPAKFNPLSFWRIARDHGMTWFSAVPTLHQLLLARAADPAGRRPAGSEKLRFVRSCSAALPPRVMHALETAFGAPVVEAYGMTEAAHQLASNPLPPAERKPGSVGRGTNVRISIMDSHRRHLPPGKRGEVVIQGDNIIRGYENNPEANAASFVDGWFKTGDQGCLDADGYLTLVGRLKELINRGGEKFSPREIDEVLLTHPAVTEAVAFGVPHATWGEEVAAAVVVREPVSEAVLLAHCSERLADFKRPKQIHVTDALPRTATGKIQRGAVAKVYKHKAKAS